MNDLLNIRNLYAAYQSSDIQSESFLKRILDPGSVTNVLLKNINLTVRENETLGIVGESGSGKSLTVKSILGLLNFNPGIIQGEIIYHNQKQANILNKNLFDSEGNKFWRKRKSLKYQWHASISGNIMVPPTIRSDSTLEVILYNMRGHHKSLEILAKNITPNSPLVLDGTSGFTHCYLSAEIEIPWSYNLNLDIEQALKSYKQEGLVIKGKEISMIFQDPKTFLNPHWSISKQINNLQLLFNSNKSEGNQIFRIFHDLKIFLNTLWPIFKKQINNLRTLSNSNKSKVQEDQILEGMKEDLIDLGLDDRRILKYKIGDLSGGQVQRIMILLSNIAKPSLIIADEPTTGLDVTLKREIVERVLKHKKSSMIFISHDLNMVRRISTRINIMFKGEILENCVSSQFLGDQIHHPYASDLLSIHDSHYSEYLQEDSNEKNEDYLGCSYYHFNCKLRKEGLCDIVSPPPIDVEKKEVISEQEVDRHWVKCWDFADYE